MQDQEQAVDLTSPSSAFAEEYKMAAQAPGTNPAPAATGFPVNLYVYDLSRGMARNMSLALLGKHKHREDTYLYCLMINVKLLLLPVI